MKEDFLIELNPSRPMHKRNAMVWGACLLVASLAAASFVMVKSGQRPRFAIHLVSLGMYSATQLVFCASVTNQTDHSIVLDGILFEWKYPSGRIGSCHGFVDWNHTLKPTQRTTTTCCVPLDAEKVRASTIDDEPGLLYRSVGRVSTWLCLDSYPTVSGWLAQKGWTNKGSFHKHPGAWMANKPNSAK